MGRPPGNRCHDGEELQGIIRIEAGRCKGAADGKPPRTPIARTGHLRPLLRAAGRCAARNRPEMAGSAEWEGDFLFSAVPRGRMIEDGSREPAPDARPSVATPSRRRTMSRQLMDI